MLSRTAAGSLVLLLLTIVLLANCATSIEPQRSLPLTPPPIAPEIARFGPLADDPPTSTATIAVTTLAVLTPTPTLIAAVTSAAAITSTSAGNEIIPFTPTAVAFLPTVTPTPAAIVLLPTPTPLPEQIPNAAPVDDTAGSETPTVVDSAQIIEEAVVLPPLTVTVSVPLPASYQAQGSFASQTVYTDSTIAQQQGTFAIVHSVAANVYGANQQVTLRTLRLNGVMDEINVYQVDHYVAVGYTEGDWLIVRRDQGSNVVRAIQPLTDLAVLFPRIIHQAKFIGQEEIGATSSLRYRIDDPKGQGARLIQSLLALSGEIRSLKLDIWIAVPGGYVVSYNFQVELSDARVLNPAGEEVRADQAVTWTYQLRPDEEPQEIRWPEDAPTPDAFPVPGFALGAFPIPPSTMLLTLVGDVPELISTLTPTEIDTFYRTELFAEGWDVEGESGLLRCSKEGASFQLLIAQEATSTGTRITILPDEQS